MSSNFSKYISILQIEIEDLRSDLNLLISRLEDDQKSARISQYTYLENKTLYLNELKGLELIQTHTGTVDLGGFTNLEELCTSLKKMLYQDLHDHGIAMAVYNHLEKKLDKIYKYISQ